MGLAEGKSRLVVIELHPVPACGAVTLATIVAHRAAMNVLRLVAAAAYPGCPVLRILVAGDAQSLGMFAAQSKAGLVVIEYGFMPIRFRMTGCAASLQSAVVGIVMAARAAPAIQPELSRQFVPFAPGIFVALFACEHLVLAVQWKRGQGVIEPVLVEAGDISIRANVFRVAPGTTGALEVAVKPLLVIYVRANRLVTVEA